MDEAATLSAGQQQALGIFADALVRFALHIEKAASDSGDLDQKIRAAGAMNQLGRGFRQTVALQDRLARAARKDAADAAKAGAPKPAPAPQPKPEPADPKSVAVRRRRDWLSRGVERCVWNEYDPVIEAEERVGESLLEDFWERLEDLMADPEAFLALDPDDLLVQLCKELGLEPPKFHPLAPPVPAAPPQAPALNGHDSS